MKKIIFFFLTSVFILSANAQQWAKSYTGTEETTSFLPTNTIYNTVCDSQGNTYIVGTFGVNADLDGA
ncbi:MAG: hypothetical protein PHO12_06095, partial [Bacteroidales bacterium]|nr:hypothetical protein [Bacteroidales bacterium]